MRQINGSLEVVQSLIAKRANGRLLSISASTVLTSESESSVYATISSAADVSLPSSGVFSGWNTLVINSDTSSANLSVKIGVTELIEVKPGQWAIAVALDAAPSTAAEWHVVYVDTSTMGTLALPTDGAYGGDKGNVSGVASGDTIEDAFDKVEVILAKLAPTKPPLLSAVTLSISSQYTAREAVSGTLRSGTVIDSYRPDAVGSSAFQDADSGLLEAKVNGTTSGSKILTTGSDVGTFTSLIISTDQDYYLGVVGKEGFWNALTATVKSASNLALGQNTYQLVHSTSGSTPILTFHVDNPVTPSVISQSLSTTSSGRYVSGVPGLNTGDLVRATFTARSAVSKHYNSTRIAAASSSYTNSVNAALPGTPPNIGADVPAAIDLTVAASKYTESASATCTAYNSKGVTGTATATSSIRIDSVSDESTRKKSGTGTFPTQGSGASQFGDAFDSTQSLLLSKELQMLNGQYRFPAQVDYSAKIPVGPNYTSIDSSTRWVTFNLGSINVASSLIVTINGAQNFGSTVIIPSFYMYVKIIGAVGTGWLDANAAYPGVGSPANDGDPALVFADSTTSVRKVTFGVLPRTGQVWVRLGFPYSTKAFSSLTLS